MIAQINDVQTASQDKPIAPEQIDMLQPDLNATRQMQDVEALSKPQETLKPMEGTESASISSMAGREALKAMRKMFVKDFEKHIQPPKKYIEDIIPDPNMTPGELVKRSTDEFDTKDTYQLNFDQLENEDDVNGMVAAIAEKNKVEIDAARGGIRKDEEILKLADDIGADPAFVAEFVNSKDSDFVSPEKILAARKILNASAIRLKKMADDIAINGNDNTEALFNFKKQYAFQQQFMMQFMAKRANIGRSLRAYGVPVGSGDEQTNAMQEMLQHSHSGLDIYKIAEQLSKVDTVKGVHEMVKAQDGLFKKMGNVFMEYFINSILSGIKTQVVNTTGSALMIGARMVDTYIAARLGTIIDTGADRILRDEWKAQIFGEINGFSDAFHTALKVAKDAEAYGGATKIESAGRQFISSEYLGVNGRVGSVIDALGKIVRAPTERVMGSTDAFMKKTVENGIIAQLAWRQANKDGLAMKLTPEEIQTRISMYMTNPTDDMLTEAASEAMHDTFQTALRQGSISQDIQRLAAKNVVTQFIMPFVKTPLNLLTQGFLERTPLGVFSRDFQEAIKAGGARAQMAQARMLTGTSIATAFGMLTLAGKTTGGGGANYSLIKEKQATGWRPYSLVFEDEKGKKTYVSYQRLEPFSYIMTTLADLKELQDVRVKLGEDDDREISKIAGALMISLSNATLDRTFMMGLQRILEAASDPTAKKMTKIITSTGASAVPSFSRDIARMFDDTKKITDGIIEEMKSKTPYFNKNLPKMRDAFGEIVKYDTILSPLPVVEGKQDPVISEMARVSASTQKSVTALPGKTYQTITMTSPQYHDLVLLSRKKIVLDGMTYKEKIKDFINSSEYAIMIDEIRAERLISIKSHYDRAGRLALGQRDKSFLDKLVKVDTAINAAQKAKMDGTDFNMEHILMQDNMLQDVMRERIDVANPEDKELFYNKEAK